MSLVRSLAREFDTTNLHSYVEMELESNGFQVVAGTWLKTIPDEKHTRPVRQVIYTFQLHAAALSSHVTALRDNDDESDDELDGRK